MLNQDEAVLLELRKAFKATLEGKQTNLKNFLKHGSMSTFADKMFSARFIPEDVHKKEDFNDIMGSFKASMAFKKDQNELEILCCNFLMILEEMDNVACDECAKNLEAGWYEDGMRLGVTLHHIRNRITCTSGQAAVVSTSTTYTVAALHAQAPPLQQKQCRENNWSRHSDGQIKPLNTTKFDDEHRSKSDGHMPVERSNSQLPSPLQLISEEQPHLTPSLIPPNELPIAMGPSVTDSISSSFSSYDEENDSLKADLVHGRSSDLIHPDSGVGATLKTQGDDVAPSESLESPCTYYYMTHPSQPSTESNIGLPGPIAAKQPPNELTPKSNEHDSDHSDDSPSDKKLFPELKMSTEESSGLLPTPLGEQPSDISQELQLSSTNSEPPLESQGSEKEPKGIQRSEMEESQGSGERTLENKEQVSDRQQLSQTSSCTESADDKTSQTSVNNNPVKVISKPVEIADKGESTTALALATTNTLPPSHRLSDTKKISENQTQSTHQKERKTSKTNTSPQTYRQQPQASLHQRVNTPNIPNSGRENEHSQSTEHHTRRESNQQERRFTTNDSQNLPVSPITELLNPINKSTLHVCICGRCTQCLMAAIFQQLQILQQQARDANNQVNNNDKFWYLLVIAILLIWLSFMAVIMFSVCCIFLTHKR